MGQASKRGTFEQRAAWAIARNNAVQQFIDKSDNKLLKKVIKHKGIQQIASYMERNGMLTISQKTSNPTREG